LADSSFSSTSGARAGASIEHALRKAAQIGGGRAEIDTPVLELSGEEDLETIAVRRSVSLSMIWRNGRGAPA